MRLWWPSTPVSASAGRGAAVRGREWRLRPHRHLVSPRQLRPALQGGPGPLQRLSAHHRGLRLPVVRRPRHLRRPAGPRVLRDEGERRGARGASIGGQSVPFPSAFAPQVNEEISVKHLPASEPDPHVVRVGWSLDSCSTQLGKSRAGRAAFLGPRFASPGRPAQARSPFLTATAAPARSRPTASSRTTGRPSPRTTSSPASS